MSHPPEDSWDDDSWDDETPDEALTCPECGNDVYSDAEACPACGRWITEADRAHAWRAGSTSGRVLRVGWWLLAAAVIGWLLLVVG